MSGKKKSGSARAVPRAYGRLTRHERDTVQRMLERRASCREIARELGRSPSTVSAEVASHRFVTAPKARRGERVDASADLSAACPRLAAWPRCCNGCGRYRAIGCKRRPHVFYEARAAQLCADSVLVSSRRGIDADEPAAAARLEAIRDCLRRGLSPEQMAARNGGPVDLSPSTIYRWVSAGYDGMTNMELRRKVGYRPRKRAAGRAATRHSARRSHAAFLALGEDACAAAWEMDTVEGAREDSACLLTLLHRPSRLQLALPLEEKTAGCVADALEGVRAILGAEFSDEAAIAALLGEGPGETRLFYCDPRRSDQKGACERNHVEIRKLLPKGAGIRFDRLAPADLALAMSHVNSEPRGALGFATPARAFRAMLGEDAAALLDAYGVEDVPLGDLDLTPGLIERARAERGDAPLA
ncbi:IS30 family transposase [uncultured Rothia sp.]|uniref:IS30 family transposase n=1 Tax=uncultured Rothia sp. TaxID=316088 RepID=UPI0025EC0A34|nr:IS30 family transposase [uncultured Rothia sp.]